MPRQCPNRERGPRELLLTQTRPFRMMGLFAQQVIATSADEVPFFWQATRSTRKESDTARPLRAQIAAFRPATAPLALVLTTSQTAVGQSQAGQSQAAQPAQAPPRASQPKKSTKARKAAGLLRREKCGRIHDGHRRYAGPRSRRPHSTWADTRPADGTRPWRRRSA